MLLLFFFVSIYGMIIKVTFQENMYTVPEINSENNGELFIQKVLSKKTPENNPKHLIFTAPYKICKGTCQDPKNLNMIFPLYIGLKKSRTAYSNLYSRDLENIYSTLKAPPFKSRSTMMPYTFCPDLGTKPNSDTGGTMPPRCSYKYSKVNWGTKNIEELKRLN